MEDFELNHFFNKICLEGVLNNRDHSRIFKFCINELEKLDKVTENERNLDYVEMLRSVGNFHNISWRSNYCNFGMYTKVWNLEKLRTLYSCEKSYSPRIPTSGSWEDDI